MYMGAIGSKGANGERKNMSPSFDWNGTKNVLPLYIDRDFSILRKNYIKIQFTEIENLQNDIDQGMTHS